MTTIETPRAALVKRAFQLEWLSVAWMTAEAGIAIAAGVSAHSLTLRAFGADSIIELISACVLLWRLSVELHHGQRFSEDVERRASRIGAALLGALTLYVVISAAWGLWTRQHQEFSAIGCVLAAAAIPVMYGLAKAKIRIADAIGSRALRADAVESVTCGYLSAVVLVGLVAQWLLRAWWVDSASALLLVPLLVREAREAWEVDD